MNAVKVAGNVDENRQLSARVPATIPPGPVTILIVPALQEAGQGRPDRRRSEAVTILIVPALQEDEAGTAWAAGIAREWADELRDPGQNIYALTDGGPVDES